ncbi:unnamed protein product [Vitrella brassicaformis CCMP3155]|uniref:Chromo domain-containing protein n=4 Tax=Vitrella brassicaformis TaxID=1169539 RepID=A0A0G4H1F3_VITBC|nr:unnamed protein product [Vitrella brassicaformis CCMP3155]|eukprot:CEM37425.1 unnamed protein product [Vitrella brassicaformis CCMP3155]
MDGTDSPPTADQQENEPSPGVAPNVASSPAGASQDGQLLDHQQQQPNIAATTSQCQPAHPHQAAPAPAPAPALAAAAAAAAEVEPGEEALQRPIEEAVMGSDVEDGGRRPDDDVVMSDEQDELMAEEEAKRREWAARYTLTRGPDTAGEPAVAAAGAGEPPREAAAAQPHATDGDEQMPPAGPPPPPAVAAAAAAAAAAEERSGEGEGEGEGKGDAAMEREAARGEDQHGGEAAVDDGGGREQAQAQAPAPMELEQDQGDQAKDVPPPLPDLDATSQPDIPDESMGGGGGGVGTSGGASILQQEQGEGTASGEHEGGPDDLTASLTMAIEDDAELKKRGPKRRRESIPEHAKVPDIGAGEDYVGYGPLFTMLRAFDPSLRDETINDDRPPEYGLQLCKSPLWRSLPAEGKAVKDIAIGRWQLAVQLMDGRCYLWRQAHHEVRIGCGVWEHLAGLDGRDVNQMTIASSCSPEGRPTTLDGGAVGTAQKPDRFFIGCVTREGEALHMRCNTVVPRMEGVATVAFLPQSALQSPSPPNPPKAIAMSMSEFLEEPPPPSPAMAIICENDSKEFDHPSAAADHPQPHPHQQPRKDRYSVFVRGCDNFHEDGREKEHFFVRFKKFSAKPIKVLSGPRGCSGLVLLANGLVFEWRKINDDTKPRMRQVLGSLRGKRALDIGMCVSRGMECIALTADSVVHEWNRDEAAHLRLRPYIPEPTEWTPRLKKEVWHKALEQPYAQGQFAWWAKKPNLFTTKSPPTAQSPKLNGITKEEGPESSPPAPPPAAAAAAAAAAAPSARHEQQQQQQQEGGDLSLLSYLISFPSSEHAHLEARRKQEIEELYRVKVHVVPTNQLPPNPSNPPASLPLPPPFPLSTTDFSYVAEEPPRDPLVSVYLLEGVTMGVTRSGRMRGMPNGLGVWRGGCGMRPVGAEGVFGRHVAQELVERFDASMLLRESPYFYYERVAKMEKAAQPALPPPPALAIEDQQPPSTEPAPQLTPAAAAPPPQPSDDQPPADAPPAPSPPPPVIFIEPYPGERNLLPICGDRKVDYRIRFHLNAAAQRQKPICRLITSPTGVIVGHVAEGVIPTDIGLANNHCRTLTKGSSRRKSGAGRGRRRSSAGTRQPAVNAGGLGAGLGIGVVSAEGGAGGAGRGAQRRRGRGRGGPAAAAAGPSAAGGGARSPVGARGVARPRQRVVVDEEGESEEDDEKTEEEDETSEKEKEEKQADRGKADADQDMDNEAEEDDDEHEEDEDEDDEARLLLGAEDDRPSAREGGGGRRGLDDGYEGEWEVRTILDKRQKANGQIEYKVQWTMQGFSPTWEPAENLKNAQELIDTFNATREQTRSGRAIVKRGAEEGFAPVEVLKAYNLL